MNLYEQLKELGTSAVSDALDACKVEGALLGLRPLAPGITLIGPAYTIQYASLEKKAEFQNAADYIDSVPASAVIVIDNQGRSDCTTWGSILTEVALEKKIAGTLVHGAIRDATEIKLSRYPIYCQHVFMRSGKNRVHKIGEQCPLQIQGITINPGDIIYGDEDGVLVIPLPLLAEVIAKANNVKRTEKNIKAAVKRGTSLAQARRDFRYDMPWLD